MPPLKNLEQHVRDQTFRARRHHELLAGPDVPFGRLALVQRDYRLATSEPERRHVAIAFEQTIALALRTSLELSAEQHMLATIGPLEPYHVDPATGAARPATKRGRRWHCWDQKHGLAWRQKHDCLTPRDVAALARGETVDPTARTPSPPGWSTVS